MQGRDHRLNPILESESSRKASAKLAERSFQPAWWCSSPHSQTIFAYFFRPFAHLPFHRKRLETLDGDFIDLDFLPGDPEQPLVLVVHGLEGSSRASYIQSFLGELQKTGRPICAMNFRGCSGEMNRLPITYHSGKTEDLDFVVNYLHQALGQKKIDLVGFSIGGNLILKWLGDQGHAARNKIRKSLAVSVPYDLVKSVLVMDRGFNRQVYTRKLLWSLKDKAVIKAKTFPDLFNLKRVMRTKTFYEFDSLITAPLNGFKDAMDYWTRSSCLYSLKDICIETGLLHSEDDPFYPGHLFPFDAVKQSDYLVPLWTRKGGHLGFINGSLPWKQNLWLEKTMVDFLCS
ncbi:MAG: alpha/beta fold hydrolase [Candidatus Omnitrophica bacterium]|nr:alpha/beta fold hydrolase [Candidatus Omnitrophota bacterium]